MIVGYKKLNAKLESLSKANVKSAIGQAISFVQDNAKANCPVGDGELRESIFTRIQGDTQQATGICYTNKEYAPYVEFGTGPKGQKSHAGISPDVAVAYSQSPWWIHESQIDKGTAEKYHFFYVDTPQGRFYQCTGQAAQPFMYPALKNHEEDITEIFEDSIRGLL